MKYIIFLLALSGCVTVPRVSTKFCWQADANGTMYSCVGNYLDETKDHKYTKVEYECDVTDPTQPHIMLWPSPHFHKGTGWIDTYNIRECGE